jgi:hypothetical protein
MATVVFKGQVSTQSNARDASANSNATVSLESAGLNVATGQVVTNSTNMIGNGAGHSSSRGNDKIN